MKLIDADSFKKQIAEMTVAHNYPVETANALCDLIDKQPVAFDETKVIERLELLIAYGACTDCEKCRYYRECWNGEMGEKIALEKASSVIREEEEKNGKDL